LKEIKEDIRKFVQERDWDKHHFPKDLALSISLEASELLENFQWRTSDEAVKDHFEDIKDELADVLIYSIMLAEKLELNIEDIIKNKMEKNRKKYPV
jgi:NTP pyrophosphatase (non-canonical NTP hydrolase)